MPRSASAAGVQAAAERITLRFSEDDQGSERGWPQARRLLLRASCSLLLALPGWVQAAGTASPYALPTGGEGASPIQCPRTLL